MQPNLNPLIQHTATKSTGTIPVVNCLAMTMLVNVKVLTLVAMETFKVKVHTLVAMETIKVQCMDMVILSWNIG